MIFDNSNINTAKLKYIHLFIRCDLDEIKRKEKVL